MGYYKQSDGLKYIMEQRWKKKLRNQFPSTKGDLIKSYFEIEAFLREYHANVNLGAAVNGDGLLTDHGVDHVQMVIKKAYSIMGEERVGELNGYEIFLLLLAIHFHDIGNIYGREDHERKIEEVIEKMGAKLPLDTVEKMCVKQIATAHGGYADEQKTDKDTIQSVPPAQPCNEIKIRPAILATVLRFADELSDDFSRSSTDCIEIPEKNSVFHAYSKALEPIFFEGETVSFHYRIPYEQTQKPLKKNDKDVFLYDEIRTRLTKCMRELEYCRKYAEGFIRVNTVNVNIDIMDKAKPLAIADKDAFRLRTLGYPNESEFRLENLIVQPDHVRSVCNRQTLKYASGRELKRAMSRR